MEFLMTYGWALLVVLIAIGALAFFGVLNPSKFLPNACFLGPGLACEDFKVEKSTNLISLKIRNGMGTDFDVFTVHIDKKSPGGVEVCGGFLGFVTWPPNSAPFGIFRDGEVRDVADGVNMGINCDKTNTFNSRQSTKLKMPT